MKEKFTFENKLNVVMATGTMIECTGKTFVPIQVLGDYIVCDIEGDELPTLIGRKDLYKSTKDERFLPVEERANLEYKGLLDSGMFWEMYPNLTGRWSADKDGFVEEFLKMRLLLDIEQK
jgi:hypothetical protein